MAYDSLKKLYYLDKSEDKSLYKMTYQQRLSAGILLPITIREHPMFFVETPEVSGLMYQILRADKDISTLQRELPGVALIQYSRKCLIDEILLSNQIEGIHSSRNEINSALDATYRQTRKGRFDGISKKYDKLNQGETGLPKTCKDIRTLYDELVSDEVTAENPKHLLDGVLFRKEQTELVSAAQKVIHKGVYPEEAIISAMEQALSFLHDESIEPLFRICLFHYLFEYIHPFYDGNGRTGRFLVSCGLSRFLEPPLLSYRISKVIKDNIKDYYRAFALCNEPLNLGDTTPFLLMMLEIILKATQDLKESLSLKKKDWENYRLLIPTLPHAKERNIDKLYDLLIQAALFAENGISTRDLEYHLSVSYSTVKNLLKKAEPSKLLLHRQVGREKYYYLDQDRLAQLRLDEIGL